MLKLAEIRTGICSAAASTRRFWSGSNPVVPTTSGMPRSRHGPTRARVPAGSEKSIMASSLTPGSSADASVDAERPDAGERAGVLAELGVARPVERRGRAGARGRPWMSWISRVPIRPVAPWMPIARTGVATGERSLV